MKAKHITVPLVQAARHSGEKLTMLTAYDYLTASILDQAGIDILLVGDTLGMVFQGHRTTLPVTLDEIIYHTKAVCRGCKRALVVADLPFMTYQVSADEALRSAGRILKETGAQAVKLEGGRQVVEMISTLVNAGIPVMGHVGLAPQSGHLLGGFKVQGKTLSDIRRMMKDIEAVEAAGAFSVVIEAVPWQVAKWLTDRISIPTIGIGAGVYCTGQVLVTADLLGMFTAFQPHFVRRFANLAEISQKAVEDFIHSVREGTFPSLDESYSLDEETLNAYLKDPESEEEASGGRSWPDPRDFRRNNRD